LIVIDKKLYFEEDAKVIFGEDLKQETKKRDGYLHRIYKNQLKEESEEKLTQTQCMLEKLSYPSLVASHIKPFIQCLNDDEAYDPNNGLLLSRNMDILFDQGYISFNDDGTIIYSPQLNKDVITHLDNYKLDSIFINENRIQYFDYHRKNVFRQSA
jgi:predicted restriction endonuclease